MCHLLLERTSNYQITVLFVIIYSTVIFDPILATVVFSLNETKSIYWKMKESLLIMRDKPSLNRYIDSAPLYLFVKVS